MADSLPSGLVCTAVPTRLRHVSGQIEPALSIPWIDPYIECIQWIETEELSKNYRHSTLPAAMEKWATFERQDPDGSALLANIGDNGCPTLKTDTEGEEAIDQVFRTRSWRSNILADVAKLAFLNSLVRICRAFGKEVDMGHPNDWPILSVEFAGLKEYSQILPGPFTVGW